MILRDSARGARATTAHVFTLHAASCRRSDHLLDLTGGESAGGVVEVVLVLLDEVKGHLGPVLRFRVPAGFVELGLASPRG